MNPQQARVGDQDRQRRHPPRSAARQLGQRQVEPCPFDKSRPAAGIAIVGQDQLRRDILHVNEKPGNLTVGYLDLSARYALDHGLHRTSTHHQAAGRRLTPRMR